ncbi:hypothetical protein INS49_001483 [Diaporthe citri]|uniref:uncharacterized protein n=1 Tax=Diaporthe citri TaxID=83186 RepID=UPI001C820DDA|nr:uncharacterized protein INS49_001483 [Diaporthe citri]KAG6367296.1 hypothetical protein INS49_001483 [Diaporthe citri]
MPSLSFFKKRKSRDRQSNSRTSARDDSRTDPAEENLEHNAHGLDPAHATGETSVAGTGASGHSTGTGAAIASPDDAKNVPKEDERTKARLARRSSTRELIRGFLGHSSRGNRRDLDTGRSSPSWTSRSAASTPLPEHRPLRSEHEHEHEHEHQQGPELGTEHKLGHGIERGREPESEPEHASPTAAATATATEAPAHPSPTLRKNPSQRPRPVSAIAATSDTGSSLPGRWKSQRLKRLQSLAFRPREKRDKDNKKTETPQVTVTPATATTSSPSPHSASASGSFSPASPRSPVNPDKPLPSPPSEHQSGPGTTTSSPPLRLNRIMATLSDQDLEKLFSGAPQFFARAEGHYTGAPHPSVAFPWDESLVIRDLTDHSQIDDAAWGCVTAWPHITRDVDRGPSASTSEKMAAKRRAHFFPRCRERPNMLSMQGLEKGTMGYQAALELGVSDALKEEQWGFGSLGAKDKVVIEARQAALTSKDGLRRLDETTVLDHLMKNAQRYQEEHRKDKATCHELFQELFTHILHLPNRSLTNPYSLPVQIMALLKVLAAPNVWVDFSHVEWRIRLGQILWGTPDEDDEDSVSDGASITDAEDSKGLHEERYWLLLQILLACELLVRLDAITEGDELPEDVRRSDVYRFERDANSSVKWSLHLARAWLENIEITKTKPSGDHETPKGWLANLTQKMTLTSDRPHSKHHDAHKHPKEQFIYVMKGKYWERQVRGLTHFARRLKWPELETQASRISDNCRAVTEGTPLNTPLESPFSTRTGKTTSSYFTAANNDGSLERKASRRQKVGAALHPAGWLSKSYVSGLMLPGEGLYHFIMSTLIENDVTAMTRLGPMANLCGGFMYQGKSFWSTACVVGRVLAAGKGAVECMGWISSDVMPLGLGDGWVDVDVEDIPEDVKRTGKQARLWGKLAIERESSVLGEGSEQDSVLPADFIIPYENNYKSPPPTISVELRSLILSEPLDSVQTTPTLEIATPFSDFTTSQEMRTYTPTITFNVTNWEEDDDEMVTIPVAKDVNFVTAHPCVPSQHVRILKSPSSPTIQQFDLSGPFAPGNGKQSGHAKIKCHPLHKYYTYTAIHLSELLNKPNWTLEQLLTDASSNFAPSIAPASSTDKPPRVLVIDAMTNFLPQPEAHEIPLSPAISRASTNQSSSSRHSSLSSASGRGGPDMDIPGTSPDRNGKNKERDRENSAKGTTEQNMHSETRRRQFGSDMEILVRALCAERGWNALISRRRRGCLACAIREAGALGWRVVIRVD